MALLLKFEGHCVGLQRDPSCQRTHCLEGKETEEKHLETKGDEGNSCAETRFSIAENGRLALSPLWGLNLLRE